MTTAGADGTLVLGAGMSGLGAGRSLRAPVYEATDRPGGVCCSTYVTAEGVPRDPLHEDVSDCFRFEPAGGHWLFVPDDASLDTLRPYARFRSYVRRAAVYFASTGQTVPFPLQEHLHHLPEPLRRQILSEILAPSDPHAPPPHTFRAWLLAYFGPTLCGLFFFPFNERYTAGLLDQIAPQDAYKSPIRRERILAGASAPTAATGYNATFHYPEGGLDHLVRALAAGLDIHYHHRVRQVDPARRTIHFEDGTERPYRRLVSSLPLARMLAIAGLPADPDPATAVLVVNIAAERGPACPHEHWLYVPDARSGLHRVGLYSEVDPDFVPTRRRHDVVSLYVERAYPSGGRPDTAATERACHDILAELQEWGFIGTPILVRPTFTDPAYTWSRPGSTWVDQARRTLRDQAIEPIGRYGTWRFQGMLESYLQGRATLGRP